MTGVPSDLGYAQRGTTAGLYTRLFHHSEVKFVELYRKVWSLLRANPVEWLLLAFLPSVLSNIPLGGLCGAAGGDGDDGVADTGGGAQHRCSLRR